MHPIVPREIYYKYIDLLCCKRCRAFYWDVVSDSGTLHLAPSRYQLAGGFRLCRGERYSFAKRLPFRKLIVAYFALVPINVVDGVLFGSIQLPGALQCALVLFKVD